MQKNIVVAWCLLSSACAVPVFAQQTGAVAPPQVKVNLLNVCTPSTEEQKEIAQALDKIPKQPLFSADFEVSRGRSTLDQSPNFLQPGQGARMSAEVSTASYVRIRREFAVQAMFSSVQYSFSDDGQNMVETLVLHVRDPKALIQVSIEDSAAASVSPAAMLVASTPASRMRLERFGKSSVALARCAASEDGRAADQSALEPLFRAASAVLANYRRLLGIPTLVPAEMAKISSRAKTSVRTDPPASKKTK